MLFDAIAHLFPTTVRRVLLFEKIIRIVRSDEIKDYKNKGQNNFLN